MYFFIMWFVIYLVIISSSVICHMPLEFRKYIESKLVIDYGDYPWFKEPTRNGRKILLKPTKKNIKTQHQKIKEEIIIPSAQSTVNLDDIKHFEVTKNHPRYSKVMAFEADFSRLLGMLGYKYVYKRDMYWRTWRLIENNKRNVLLRYRAENRDEDMNCPACHNQGYWVIEDGPPQCPYEIFSMINSSDICVSDITHFAENENKCTSFMELNDLKLACHNPVITRWRFTRSYDIPERQLSKSMVCEGREKCEIVTIYQFQPGQIVFRIVNSENIILYSRIMRQHRKNFACAFHCGEIDLKTMNVTKNKPFAKLANADSIVNSEDYEGTDTDSLESSDFQAKGTNDEKVIKDDLQNPFHKVNPDDVILTMDDAAKYLFVDKKPYVNWNSRGFDFKHNVYKSNKDGAKSNDTKVDHSTENRRFDFHDNFRSSNSKNSIENNSKNIDIKVHSITENRFDVKNNVKRSNSQDGAKNLRKKEISIDNATGKIKTEDNPDIGRSGKANWIEDENALRNSDIEYYKDYKPVEVKDCHGEKIEGNKLNCKSIADSVNRVDDDDDDVYYEDDRRKK